MTREQLGLDQEDPKVLRLPDGLEVVGDEWFSLATIEKLVVPSCVKVLGESAFIMCERLNEVVFEQGSRLERIERCCFDRCNLTKIVLPESVQYIGEFCFSDCLNLREVVIPRSVRKIDGFAFSHCHQLSSLVFEEGSQLTHIGHYAFDGTQLTPEQRRYPNSVRKSD